MKSQRSLQALRDEPNASAWGYSRLVVGALLVLTALVAFPLLLNPEAREFYVSEEGPVQVFSAAGYLVVVVILLREFDPRFLRRHFYFVLIPVVMCLRELDLHAAFTPISITKTLFFVSPEIGVYTKLVVVALYAGLIAGAWLLVSRHWRGFIDGLRRFDFAATAIAISMVLGIASKTIDGPAKKFRVIGVELQETHIYAFTALEEVLEMGIPVFFAIALFAYIDTARRERQGNGLAP